MLVWQKFGSKLIRPRRGWRHQYGRNVHAILKARGNAEMVVGSNTQRGVREADGARLESVFTSDRNKGSNPFLSAYAGVAEWWLGQS